ncbi:MAG: adenylyl-sulfate kinase [Prosthecobacter sp.]|uniref:adenylyl-sulfate kinase n=1 Tax=Prosthecobacter sp. TaxID=1965333 RepID=UPI0038FEDFB6
MKPVLWLFGLPSSGKTTLSRDLRDHLQAAGTPVVLLDGDDLRSGLCADLGYSDADRSENLRRAGHLAQLLAAQGNTVICAFVTPKEHHRELVRQILGERVKFIHIDCPLEVCVARDVKGLYAKAAAQQMTGTQDGFEAPLRADLGIRTDNTTVPRALDRLLAALKEP